MARHLLLTGLGLGARPGSYKLDGAACEAALSPAALWNLLPESERPTCVLAFCTSEARTKTFPALEQALSGLVQVEAVETPPGVRPGDIDEFLQRMVKAVADHGAEQLTLDLTQGPRHFALLLYVGVLYLQSLGRVRVKAAYYCFENETPRPFFELTPLLTLPRWIHAIDNLTEARDAVPLAGLLRQSRVSGLAPQMRLVTEAFASGLPLELGIAATRLVREMLRPLRRTLRQEPALPFGNELVAKLEEWLRRYELPEAPREKASLALTRNELERQARLVDDLIEQGNLRSAFGLMEEWVFSWALLQLGRTADWLEFKQARRQAGQRLRALLRVRQDPQLRSQLTDGQADLAEFWEDLTGLRNSLAHHGMRKQFVSSADDQFGARTQRVFDYWRKTMRAIPEIPLEFEGRLHRRLLVSPVGDRPGVLFSAVRAAELDGTDGDALLVICSSRTEAHIEQALQRSGFSGPWWPLRFENPYAGVDERKRLIEQARPHLVATSEVLVNITGGTTLMGLLADELATEARQLARPVRRFGLIDRRSAEDQQRDPYVAGEPLWLDGAGGSEETAGA